jgi:hypothetical protein
MGRNLYITGASTSWKQKTSPLTESEWRTVAEADSALAVRHLNYY